jgi:hypothetical protein
MPLLRYDAMTYATIDIEFADLLTYPGASNVFRLAPAGF